MVPLAAGDPVVLVCRDGHELLAKTAKGAALAFVNGEAGLGFRSGEIQRASSRTCRR